uniref:Uncharacterized protein n=1 Tax=Alexandrium andersonii TaxID=327968 RepID=A0A7S2HTE1_9DINO
MRNLDTVFLAAGSGGGTWANGTRLPEDQTGSSRPWWSAAGACAAANASDGSANTECSLGFSWESSATIGTDGRIRGSGGAVQATRHMVHCVEVEQSTVDGEYATSLSLQWFDEIGERYRTLLWRSVTGGGVTQMAHQQLLAAECFGVAGS